MVKCNSPQKLDRLGGLANPDYKPKTHPPSLHAEFKAEVALAALTERQPLAKLTTRYQLAPAQITR